MSLAELSAAEVKLQDDVFMEPYELGHGLPVFITPKRSELGSDQAAFKSWFIAMREDLMDLTHQRGAVVLRGFAVHQTEDFAAIIDGFKSPEFGYAGGATPRGALADKVFESTKYPSQYKLPMHQEMAYLPHYPSALLFFCRLAAETGGETIIGNMREFGRSLPPKFADALRDKGVRYVRNYRDPAWSTGNQLLDDYHRPWTDSLGTTDRAEAEKLCRDMGVEPRWEANGSLSMIYVGPAFVSHPETGEEIWFNQLVTQFYTPELIGEERYSLIPQHYSPGAPPPVQVTFGDGTLFDPDLIVSLAQNITSKEVAFPWQDGDIMILDNFLTAHGRNPFTGKRDVQVALVA